MAKIKYNHRRRIVGIQSAKIKSLMPGMIVQFGYKGENIFDETPLILLVWNEFLKGRIHGINLNYLTEYKIKLIFNKLISGPEKGVHDDNILIEEDQQTDDYDDNLPYRNLLTEPYTRLKLPTVKEFRDGNPTSKSQADKQMKVLYNEVLKKLMNKYDIYRTYKTKQISTIKAVRYDIEGLLQ